MIMCNCKDPITGEVKDVPAKTKEMIYRTQMPQFKKLIDTEQQMEIVNDPPDCNDSDSSSG